jgi:hypothetical protein
MVPETKGKTPNEVLRFFTKGRELIGSD